MTCRYCPKPDVAKRLCWGHYKRLQKYGDPLGLPDMDEARRKQMQGAIDGAAKRTLEEHRAYGRKGGLTRAANAKATRDD